MSDQLLTGLQLAWLFGCLVVIVRVGIQVGRQRRTLRAAGSAPPALQQQMVRLARQLGVAPVRLCVSDQTLTPYLACVGRPTLVWPISMTNDNGIGASGAAAMLIHELAHLRRRDH